MCGFEARGIPHTSTSISCPPEVYSDLGPCSRCSFAWVDMKVGRCPLSLPGNLVISFLIHNVFSSVGWGLSSGRCILGVESKGSAGAEQEEHTPSALTCPGKSFWRQLKHGRKVETWPRAGSTELAGDLG